VEASALSCALLVGDVVDVFFDVAVGKVGGEMRIAVTNLHTQDVGLLERLHPHRLAIMRSTNRFARITQACPA
jgi:hypothetical protein